MIENDLKIIKEASKSAMLLKKNLNALDFELAKFNRFVKKIESFKVNVVLLVSSLSFFLGFAICIILSYIKN